MRRAEGWPPAVQRVSVMFRPGLDYVASGRAGKKGGMNATPMQTKPYGPLTCLVQDGAASAAFPRPVIPVILCHGYGAPGSDLAGLATYLLDWLGERAGAFRLIFPAAPLTLEEVGMPEGRAWWPLNMAALQQLLQTSQFEQLHDSKPPGLEEARNQLTQMLAEVFQQMPSVGEAQSPPRYVLGGFSQGAMLTMDAALRGPAPPPELLVQFSGTLICQSEWRDAAPRLKDTRVLQSHGRFDPILPFRSAESLRELLEKEGAAVTFLPFDGPHTIDTDALMRLTQCLAEIADDVSPDGPADSEATGSADESDDGSEVTGE